ncbi:MULTISPECIES: hypothetical protein [unclassified Bradyrhizobium]|uniref:hypothetical protein n=1 Tax=Bradyrhizobium TaxID=374 RepID=UPI0028E88B73|nr:MULTISPECIES: hypothetical protein [unclassified Bradyrhizobium]
MRLDGLQMKLVMGILVAALVLAGMATGRAAVRIADDPGGRIGTYVDKYKLLRDSGEHVIIDGICGGACTIVLGTLPRDRICITPRAVFTFRETDNLGLFLRPVPNPEATQMLFDLYPAPIKRWITRHGGLTAQPIFLRGKELQALYRPCAINVPTSGGASR